MSVGLGSQTALQITGKWLYVPAAPAKSWMQAWGPGLPLQPPKANDLYFFSLWR
jgi:hypothetical protein